LSKTNGYEFGTSLSQSQQSSLINSSEWALQTATVKSEWWDGNSVVSLHDTLFTLGGWKTGPVVTDSIFYSVNSGVTWVGYAGKLPFAAHTFVCLNSPDGWVYMIGGDYLSTSTQQKSVYRTRDLVNWTLMTNDYGGGVRILGAGIVDDFGNLYWLGGQSNLQGDALNDIWKSTDGGATWSQIATGISVGGNSFLGQNINGSGVYFNGRVYIVGGGVYDDSGIGLANFTFTKKVYSAQLSDLTKWRAENDLPFLDGRQYLSVAVWDGKIWAACGDNSIAANTDSAAYMNAAGTWALLPQVPQVLNETHAAGIAVHRDQLFIVAGNNSNAAFMLSRTGTLNVPTNIYIGSNPVVQTSTTAVSNNPIPFYTAVSTLGKNSGLTFTNLKKVINTQSDVYSSDNNIPEIQVNNTSTTDSYSWLTVTSGSGGSDPRLLFQTHLNAGTGTTKVGTTTNHALSLYTNNTLRATFPAAGGFNLTSGLMGVGTSGPNELLEVFGPSANAPKISVNSTGGVSTDLGFVIRTSNITVAQMTANMSSGEVKMGATLAASGFFPTFYADGTERMRISTTGAVRMHFYGAGTATFDASGNITSVSDERLKTAIKPYTSGLKQLLLLKPIQYKWNEKSGNETKETYAGFSAQNVKSAIPYGTGENKDGYLSLQERAIVATLVNAVKEQQQQIEELKREIIKLQNK